MYVPAHFQEKELDAIHQLVRDHSFGMLMVNGDQVPEVSHLCLCISKLVQTMTGSWGILPWPIHRRHGSKMTNLRWLFFQESILIFHPGGTSMKIRFQPGIIRLSMPMEH